MSPAVCHHVRAFDNAVVTGRGACRAAWLSRVRSGGPKQPLRALGSSERSLGAVTFEALFGELRLEHRTAQGLHEWLAKRERAPDWQGARIFTR
jgi:hypothetical protein